MLLRSASNPSMSWVNKGPTLSRSGFTLYRKRRKTQKRKMSFAAIGEKEE